MLDMTHRNAGETCVSDHETLMTISGTRIGRMMALGLNRNEDVVCVCDCGETEVIERDVWISGSVIQCSSCDEWQGASYVQQEIADPDTYDALVSRGLGAKDRCENPNNPAYCDYGGRGIRFEFFNAEHFAFDMWNKGWRFGDPRTTDRIEVNGPYSPENTRLAMPVTQTRNRRNTVVVDTGDDVIALADLAEQHGIQTGTAEYTRLSHFVAKTKQDADLVYNQIIDKIYEITGGEC